MTYWAERSCWAGLDVYEMGWEVSGLWIGNKFSSQGQCSVCRAPPTVSQMSGCRAHASVEWRGGGEIESHVIWPFIQCIHSVLFHSLYWILQLHHVTEHHAWLCNSAWSIWLALGPLWFGFERASVACPGLHIGAMLLYEFVVSIKLVCGWICWV